MVSYRKIGRYIISKIIVSLSWKQRPKRGFTTPLTMANATIMVANAARHTTQGLLIASCENSSNLWPTGREIT